MKTRYDPGVVTVRRFPIVLTTALLVSCGSTAAPGMFDLADLPATPAALDVEVGVGQSAFTPIADGEPVDLTYGAQGGYHIWMAVRVSGGSATGVQVNVSARRDDGSLAGPASRAAVGLRVEPDGSATAANLRNFIDDAGSVRGKALTLRAEVVAADGKHGAGERRVAIR